MSLNFKYLLPACTFIVLSIVACESHIQGADDAFDQVKEEKSKIQSSPTTTQDVKKEPVKLELVTVTQAVDEWTVFKISIEKKISLNELKIKELKASPDANSKLLKKIAALEEDNRNILKEMNDYNEEVKLKWETFKATVNHTIKEIDIEISGISKNAKK
jgi:hypothetical protein